MAIRRYTIIVFLLAVCSICFSASNVKHGADVRLTGDGAKITLTNNSQTFSLAAPSDMSESVDYTWPPADGDSGHVLKTDGSGVLSFASGSVFAHDILSITHTDSVADAVTRGSIIYGNSTPKWDELVIGADGTVLKSDGTDVSWESIITIIAGDNLTLNDSTLDVDDAFIVNDADDTMLGKFTVQKQAEQFEIAYDDLNNATFFVDASGNLLIKASGGSISFNDDDIVTSGTEFVGRLMAGGVTSGTYPFANDFSADDNCVALWNLDDGALVTDSKGTNTLTNDGVTADTTNFKQGDASGVFTDVTDDFMTITDADLDAGFPFKNGDTTKNISVCCWVYLNDDDSGVFESIWSKGGSGFPRLQVGTAPMGAVRGIKVFYTITPGLRQIDLASTPLEADRWYHIGFTYENSTNAYVIRIWDEDAKTVTLDAGFTEDDLTVGNGDFFLTSSGGVSNFTDAQLDEVVVFKDVLTITEIDQIRRKAFNPVSAPTTAIHMFSVDALDLNHIQNTGDNVGIAGDVEVHGEGYFGGIDNFTVISGGQIYGPDVDISAGTGDWDTTGIITSATWNGVPIDVSDYTNLVVTAPITLTGDSVGIVNQGTTTTVLHGNASGNATFGVVDISDDTNLAVDIDHLKITDDTLSFSDNEKVVSHSRQDSFLEQIDFTISESAGTVTGSLEKEGGGDLTQFWSDDFDLLDCTPAKTVDLTGSVGTDTSPAASFVYILQSAKTTLVANTSWPANSVEHIRVASVVLQSATTTGTDGALMNRNWNDMSFGITNPKGGSIISNQRTRKDHAQWDSGVVLTVTGTGTSTITIDTTAGVVFQLNPQTFPPVDMAGAGDIHLVNLSSSEYSNSVNLAADITTLADGVTSLGNNKYFSVVIWGAQNRTGQTSHLMCNLPIGQYGKQGDATVDAEKFSVHTIPDAFRGIGFLISELTFQFSSGGGGSWDLIQEKSLLGQLPILIPGGGTTNNITTFVDTAFEVFDNLDDTKRIALQASSIATGTTRTITMADADVDLANLVTLSDNSIADALHRHSELVASDGSPDPAVSVNAAGYVAIGHIDPLANVDIRENTGGDHDFFRFGFLSSAQPRLIGGVVGFNGFLALCDSTGNTDILFDSTNAGISYISSGSFGIRTTTPTLNADLTLGDGVLCLAETTTPTADTNFGKIYTKADNKLYFQDGAGVEHEIALVP